MPQKLSRRSANSHFAARIGCRLHQHGYRETGEAQCIGDRAFVAKVRKRDDDAVEGVAVLLEKRGAALGFFKRFDRAEFRLFRRQRHDVGPRLLENAKHVFATGGREMIREKTAIADDQTQLRARFGSYL